MEQPGSEQTARPPQTALLATKLHQPTARPGAVTRQRLADRLAAALTARATLVSAPAGFGKTTLLAQWLAAVGRDADVAWVSLDDRDDEPGRFWTYVLAAVGRAHDGMGADALPPLQGPAAGHEAGLVLLLNAFSELVRPLIVVLDDYHSVTSPPVHEAMSYLLDHLPPHVHVVMTTRADPPLPLSRLRARGELVEIRAADLRFTQEEAAEYLGSSMGLALPAEDVTALTERTEGWAAALQLAALTLQNRADPSAAVAAFAGDDRFIVDYLADEVLGGLPEDVRDFLLRTSVLRRLSGALCDAVTGQSGGSARLAELERANLFVVPLDDRRHWYRYHHLFADVLHAHLVEQHPVEISALHLRASRWHRDEGDLPSAVEHALAAGERDLAAELMEIAFPAMSRDRREPELARWADAVPDHVLRRRPVLAVWVAGALAQVSDFRTVAERLDDVETALGARGGTWPAEPPPEVQVADLEAFRSLPAMVAMYRAALALNAGDPKTTVAYAERALALAPEGNHLVRAGAAALGGLAAWATGDLRAAEAAYQASTVEMREAGHLADIYGLAITLGDLARAQGRLSDAEHVYRAALAEAIDSTGAPLRGAADMHTGLAGVLLERGELDAAMAELAVGNALGEHMGLPQNPYRSRVAHARLRQAAGDLDTALELLDEADRVYNGDYAPNVAPVPAVRARLFVRRGELSRAEAWAKERELSADDDLSYLREYEHLTLARLLLAQHADGSTQLLRRLEGAAREGGRVASLIDVNLLLALGLSAEGHPDDAVVALRTALELAEPEGWVQVFVEHAPALLPLLQSLVRRADRPGFLQQLVAAVKGVSPPPAPKGAGLVEPLSERELDVLRLLATDLSGPEIARQLHVSLNTMRTHSKNVFRKLQVTSRRAAVRRAVELALLPPHGHH